MPKLTRAPFYCLKIALHGLRVAAFGVAVSAANLTLPSVLAADVSAYGLVKEQVLVQTNAGAPALRTNEPFAFSAFVLATATNSVTSAALTLSGGGPTTNLTRDTNSGSFLLLDRFATQDDLDAAYPGGSQGYRFTIVGANGSGQTTLNFAPENYPNDPHITNFAAAQAIVANAPFTFQWEPLEGGTTNDYVQLIIVDDQTNQVFSSPPASEADALDGTSNAVTIASNTLQLGQTYKATLIFGRATQGNIVNTIIYPYLRGLSAYAKRTEFTIQTVVTVPTTRPNLEVLSLTGTTAMLRFSSEIGFTYRLEASTNLTNWATIFTTNASTTNVIYNDATVSGLQARFYRAISP